ncbi:MAG: TRAP transporter TatT component family protein [Bacteroidales bacterium]|nr:TRAP transporter TatT component family protein [Bacteroidales bacterium]
MRTIFSTKKSFTGIVVLLMLVSCTTFKPGYKALLKEEAGNKDVEMLIDQAREIEARAGTKEDVIGLIDAYRKVEKADPMNYYALWKIGNYHMLLGAADTEKRKDKKEHYKMAVLYCEKAMCTNPAFQEATRNGDKVTEALNLLTENEIDAMGYWYTARFYYFSEVLGGLGRLMNTRIVIENNKMIERIDELDSTWAGGGNYFARGLYYIAIPERFGGSKERSANEFATAIETGPEYLVNRWGRAKYLYQLIGDDEKFKADLKWVLAQNPHEAGNPYPWNVYFQEDARRMLEENK